jgi:hypothetical protein
LRRLRFRWGILRSQRRAAQRRRQRCGHRPRKPASVCMGRFLLTLHSSPGPENNANYYLEPALISWKFLTRVKYFWRLRTYADVGDPRYGRLPATTFVIKKLCTPTLNLPDRPRWRPTAA